MTVPIHIKQNRATTYQCCIPFVLIFIIWSPLLERINLGDPILFLNWNCTKNLSGNQNETLFIALETGHSYEILIEFEVEKGYKSAEFLFLFENNIFSKNLTLQGNQSCSQGRSGTTCTGEAYESFVISFILELNNTIQLQIQNFTGAKWRGWIFKDVTYAQIHEKSNLNLWWIYGSCLVLVVIIFQFLIRYGYFK